MNLSIAGILNKSITIDETLRSLKGRQIVDNQGNPARFNPEDVNYGWETEKEGVTSWETWDMRKSSAYNAKPIVKWGKGKQSDYIKCTSHHKKNKSQQNSRIVSSRSNTSMGQYNFNTNRSYLSKQKVVEQSIKKSDSDKNFGLKYLCKQPKQSKAENYIKYNPKVNKKNQGPNHVRNMSAMSFQ